MDETDLGDACSQKLTKTRVGLMVNSITKPPLQYDHSVKCVL